MGEDDKPDGDLPSGVRLTALDEAFRNDPYAALSRLLARQRVHFDGELDRWFVADHDLVRDFLRNRELSVDAGKAAPGSFARRIADTEAHPSMLGLDDPDHRRLRSFVSRAFAPAAVQAMRPAIEGIVDDALKALDGRRQFDLIAEFAAPVPFRVLAGMLGVAPSDQGRFKRWADAKVRAFDPLRTPEDALQVKQADAEIRRYFVALVDARRAAPRDDLITDLVRVNEEGQTLSEEEIVTMCNLLIVAGIVTTTDLIGNGMLALLRNPEQLRKLRQRPELMSRAVEEMLRFDSPVIQTGRIATRDMAIEGRCVARGASISLSLGAANHDPRIYPHADRFDIEREDAHHQSFGGGVHLCLGAALARLEAEIAIGRLLAAFPALRLAPGEVIRKSLPILHGCSELIVLAGS